MFDGTTFATAADTVREATPVSSSITCVETEYDEPDALSRYWCVAENDRAPVARVSVWSADPSPQSITTWWLSCGPGSVNDPVSVDMPFSLIEVAASVVIDGATLFTVEETVSVSEPESCTVSVTAYCHAGPPAGPSFGYVCVAEIVFDVPPGIVVVVSSPQSTTTLGYDEAESRKLPLNVTLPFSLIVDCASDAFRCCDGSCAASCPGGTGSHVAECGASSCCRIVFSQSPAFDVAGFEKFQPAPKDSGFPKTLIFAASETFTLPCASCVPSATNSAQSSENTLTFGAVSELTSELMLLKRSVVFVGKFKPVSWLNLVSSGVTMNRFRRPVQLQSALFASIPIAAHMPGILGPAIGGTV